MGGGGNSGPQVTTNVTKLPDWVESASQSNYDLAKEIANKPYTPYEGQTVAGFTPDQYAAQDYLRNNVGAYQGVYGQALQQTQTAANYQPDQVSNPWVNYNYTPNQVQNAWVDYNYTPQQVQNAWVDYNYSPDKVAADQVSYNYQPDNVAAQQVNYGYTPDQVSYNYTPEQVAAQQVNYSYTPDQVQAQKFTDADINAYMNPYIQNVENRALDNLERSRQLSTNTIGDQAAAAKAFGGSRHAILEGVQAAETARAAGDMSATLRSQAYDNAAGLIQADQNRALTAAQSNQSANLQNAQYGLQAQGMNQSANLAAAQSNQNAGLQASQYGLQAGIANQNAGLQNAQLGLQAQGMNQDAALRAALANQSAGLQASQYGLQAGLANQDANLRASLANQSAGLQDYQMQLQNAWTNQDQNMKAQQLNQAAGLQDYQMQLQNAQTNQQANLEAQRLNQAAGLQDYGLQLQNAWNNASNNMTAQQLNQQAGLTANAQGLTAAQLAGSLANQGQNAMLTDYGMLMNQGALQQDQQQRYLDDNYQKYLDAQNYDTNQLNILLSALGMSPYGGTSTSVSSGGRQSSGINPAGILGGLGSLASGVAALSDERQKKDIKPVGKDAVSGIPIYDFRYKDGDKTEYRGLLAQDVEKVAPDLVHEMGGKKVVDTRAYGLLSGKVSKPGKGNTKREAA